MIELRDYQQELIARIRAAFHAHRRVLLVSPTGSGKTVMFSYLGGRVSIRGKRVAIIVHRDELVDQVCRTLHLFGVPFGIIAGGYMADPRPAVQVASVFTLVRRMERLAGFDLLIVDEAHHAIGRSTWGAVIEHYRDAYVLGVTATPERLSGEGLGETFETMVLGPTTRELIERGALSPYRLFAPSTIRTDDLHTKLGDFVKGELAARADDPKITGDAVAHYRRHLQGAPAVAFCVSVEHAQHVAERFKAAGYTATSIDGKMDKALRRQIVRDFAAGRINVLTSCDLISEGFDCPGMHGAILLRPTQSLALYLQQVGRALRPCERKDDAVVLDHAGNALRHGLPDDERTWTLEGRRSKKKSADVYDPPVKICRKCFLTVTAPAAKCPHCGHPFPVEGRQVEEVDGELVEVDPKVLRAQRKREERNAQTYEELVALGYARGYRYPEKWATYVFEGRKAARERYRIARHERRATV